MGIRAGRHQHQRSMSNQNGNACPSGNPSGNGNPASEYVSQRHSLRGASLQPASLPPRQPQQQQQQAHQHHQQHQPQHQQPQHHQHQQLQQQFHQPSPQSQNHHFAHPGPASGTSSAGSKDKDKCIIS